MYRPHKITLLALVAVFLTALYLPLGWGLLTSDAEVSLAERRALNPPPRPGVDPVANLPQKITAYYHDHFGLRPDLIRWHGVLRYELLRGFAEDVLIGDEGWLYIRSRETLGDFSGDFLFAPRGLSRYARILEDRRRRLARQECAHLWAVTPNKVAIYPEHLPAALRRAAGPRRLDQLLSHLRAAAPRVALVDFRPALLRAKEKRRVYHRNDTHWNDGGVLVAYRHLCGKLRPLVPGLRPLPPERLASSRAPHKGDLAGLLGVRDSFAEVHDAVAIRRPTARPVSPPTIAALPRRDLWGRRVRLFAYQGPPGKPRLLVFCDSFVTPLFRRLLAEHFSHALFVQASPSLEIMEAVAARQRPDVVIEQLSERLLGLLPTDFPTFRKTYRR